MFTLTGPVGHGPGSTRSTGLRPVLTPAFMWQSLTYCISREVAGLQLLQVVSVKRRLMHLIKGWEARGDIFTKIEQPRRTPHRGHLTVTGKQPWAPPPVGGSIRGTNRQGRPQKKRVLWARAETGNAFLKGVRIGNIHKGPYLLLSFVRSRGYYSSGYKAERRHQFSPGISIPSQIGTRSNGACVCVCSLSLGSRGVQ